jgi:hypothetical protein
MRRVALLLAMFALLYPAVYASVIHVPVDYSTIQAGINAAVSGDTVLVSPGRYGEHLNFLGKNIVVKSEQGPGVTRLTKLDYHSRYPLVKFISGEDPGATFEGFWAESSFTAPAVLIENSSPTLKGNTFFDNVSSDGAAVEVRGGAAYVYDNFFWSNEGLQSGAIWCDQARLVASGNRFYTNHGQYITSVIYINNSANSLIHHNILFQNNIATGTQATVFLRNCINSQVYNNDFFANFDAVALRYTGCVNLRIINNIITWNSGNGIKADSSLSCTVQYNDIYYSHYLDYEGVTPGPGSISADPLFRNTDGWSNDFCALSSGSPCINTGDPSSPHDPDGSIADMGVRYYVPDSGYFAGTVVDESALPIEGALVSVVGRATFDTTDVNGCFVLGALRSDLPYDILISHYSYNETTLVNIIPEANDTTQIDMVLTIAPPRGGVEGVVTDSLGQPMADARIEIESAGVWDITDSFGHYLIGDLRPKSYDIIFGHQGYSDTTVHGFVISSGDTIALDMHGLPLGCAYMPGDINGSGSATGLDVVFGISYFKGGLHPPIECFMCRETHPFYAAGDVNGSCTFSGVDITYLVRYFKGGPALLHCLSCPPIGP